LRNDPLHASTDTSSPHHVSPAIATDRSSSRATTCSPGTACSRLSGFTFSAREPETRGRCYQLLPRGCADGCKRAPTGAPARAKNACIKQKPRQESQIEVDHVASSTSWGHWFEPSTAQSSGLEPELDVITPHRAPDQKWPGRGELPRLSFVGRLGYRGREMNEASGLSG
jgi:hypothetical protein